MDGMICPEWLVPQDLLGLVNKVASSLVCTSSGIGIATEPSQLRLEVGLPMVSAFTQPQRAGKCKRGRQIVGPRPAVKRTGGLPPV